MNYLAFCTDLVHDLVSFLVIMRIMNDCIWKPSLTFEMGKLNIISIDNYCLTYNFKRS